MSLKTYSTAMAWGASVVLNAVCAHAAPPPDLLVSEWAEEHRVVTAESGTRFPGPWNNSRTPYLTEIMDVSGVNHPNPRTVIRGGAQIGKSEVGLNVLGHMICTAPRPAMVVLPSKDEVTKYNAEKFDPMVHGTAPLTLKVMASDQRSNKGSTTTQKKFRGGKLGIVSAGTSKPFNMISIGLLILEELAEYEDDVDNRGAPDKLARTRGDAWDDEFKEIDISTSGAEGACKITEAYEAGDQRLYYVPCPDCDGYSFLEFDNMDRHDGRAITVCQGCGVLVEHHHKQVMNARGLWVPTFVSENADNPAPGKVLTLDEVMEFRNRNLEGRYRSYHLWQAYSAFKSWDNILNDWDDAQNDPSAIKAFFQQKLAIPYTPQIDKPMAEALHAACTPDPTTGDVPFPVALTRREVPDFAPMLALSCDVQGNRLEWAAWAFGPRGVAVRIDWGIVSGVPEEDQVWDTFWEDVCQKVYESETMQPIGFDIIGVDTGGGATQKVYEFCAKHRGRVLALKGKPNDRYAPAMTLSTNRNRRVKVGGANIHVPLYLVGTDGLKTKVYHGLTQIMASAEAHKIMPGTMVLTPDASLESFKQLTAENPVPQKNGGIKWEKIPYAANEQLDLAVYAQGLATESSWFTWSSEKWIEIFEQRRKANALIGAGPLEVLMAEEAPTPKKTPAVNDRNPDDVLKVLLAGAGQTDGGAANG